MGTSKLIRIDCVMRPRSSSRGRNTSASVTVTVTVTVYTVLEVSRNTADFSVSAKLCHESLFESVNR